MKKKDRVSLFQFVPQEYKWAAKHEGNQWAAFHYKPEYCKFHGRWEDSKARDQQMSIFPVSVPEVKAEESLVRRDRVLNCI